jgi:hypothetical protein
MWGKSLGGEKDAYKIAKTIKIRDIRAATAQNPESESFRVELIYKMQLRVSAALRRQDT